MSEDYLPVQPLTLDDGQDGGRARRSSAGPGRLAQRAGRSPAPEPLRPTPAVVAVAAIGVGYALVAGGFRRLTVPAELGTFLAGSLITWLALRKECRRRPAPAHLTGKGVLVWGAVLVVFGIWELYADFRGSTPDHPTLSILMGPVLQDPANRAVGYLLWLATGVWLVRR